MALLPLLRSPTPLPAQPSLPPRLRHSQLLQRLPLQLLQLQVAGELPERSVPLSTLPDSQGQDREATAGNQDSWQQLLCGI